MCQTLMTATVSAAPNAVATSGCGLAPRLSPWLLATQARAGRLAGLARVDGFGEAAVGMDCDRLPRLLDEHCSLGGQHLRLYISSGPCHSLEILALLPLTGRLRVKGILWGGDVRYLGVLYFDRAPQHPGTLGGG
jgi:hypothetical protein